MPERLTDARIDTEMTRFLAEKCMGWKYYWQGTAVKLRPADSWLAENGRDCIEIPAIVEHVGWNGDKPFEPFTRIDHAFMLVEKMRELGWWMKLTSPFDDREDRETFKVWSAGFTQFGITGWNGQADFRASDPEAARAICLAAIAALEGK